MKHTLFAAAGIAALASVALNTFAADTLPKAPAFARYEAMMNRSPFAVATAPVAPPAATPNFAKDLYIANAARTADGDLVTIASTTDKNFKKYLSTKSTVEGYSVPSVEWSDRVGATKVTISKDGQFATLTFNQALLAQAVPNTPQGALQGQVLQQAQVQQIPQPIPQANPAVQQQFPQASGVKPGGIPTLPTPPPRTRGMIQRNPGQPAQAVATPVQPQGQALASDEKE
jgi:hypothetical protein